MSDKKRIMLIDNEEGLCRMMEQILFDNGYLTKAYTSPVKAMEEFQPDAWDMVISDIKMPKKRRHRAAQGLPGTVARDSPDPVDRPRRSGIRSKSGKPWRLRLYRKTRGS